MLGQQLVGAIDYRLRIRAIVAKYQHGQRLWPVRAFDFDHDARFNLGLAVQHSFNIFGVYIDARGRDEMDHQPAPAP